MSRCLFAAIIVAASLAAVGPAVARPQYQKGFGEEYPGLKAEASRVRCGVCHCAEDKKARNGYGEALRKALTVKNEKRMDLFRQAMREVEKEPSAVEGKTFGDLIDEGRLPGNCPEPSPGSGPPASRRDVLSSGVAPDGAGARAGTGFRAEGFRRLFGPQPCSTAGRVTRR